MKKIFSLFLVGFLLVSCSESREKEVDLEEMIDSEQKVLLGKIKSLTQNEFKASIKFGEVQKGDLKSKFINKYDESGNEIENASYNREGSLCYKSALKYDGNGCFSEISKYNSEGSLSYKCTLKYEYDLKGNWTKKIKSEIQNVITKATEITEREIEYYN